MLTYNLKLNIEDAISRERLMATFDVHQEIWNYLSEFIYTKKFELSSRTLQDRKYKQCRREFNKAPSQIVIRAMHDVVSTFKTIKSNKQFEKLTKAPIKSNLSIRLDKRLYTIKGNTIKITTNGAKALCNFTPFPQFQKLREKFSMCDPLIFVRDNQIWLSVTFDNPSIPKEDNYCIGVDLGERRTAVTSEGVLIVNQEYKKKRRQIRYLKRCLRQKRSENRKKHIKNKKGQSAQRHLNQLRHDERNLSKNAIHHAVNTILKTGANTIVIEDLNNMKQNKGKRNNNRRSQVPYFMFKQILTYKAQALGKRVETVNPHYTSQDDHRGLERGERRKIRYYAIDGKVFDADLQASITIALRYAKRHSHPVSFVEPLDGGYELNGQGSVNTPNVLCP